MNNQYKINRVFNLEFCGINVRFYELISYYRSLKFIFII